MSAAESDHLAAENLRLRRDASACRQALLTLEETNAALRRENQRWREIMRLVVAETERHKLAVEAASREV